MPPHDFSSAHNKDEGVTVRRFFILSFRVVVVFSIGYVHFNFGVSKFSQQDVCWRRSCSNQVLVVNISLLFIICLLYFEEHIILISLLVV